MKNVMVSLAAAALLVLTLGPINAQTPGRPSIHGSPTKGGPVTAPAPTQGAGTINFGDDSAQYANDGECDDPRFAGPGLADSFGMENVGKDASDCAALLAAGQLQIARVKGEASVAECAQINFGDDRSQWANDGNCDDPRFTGDGIDPILNVDDTMRDASECRALCQAGQVWLREGTTAAAGPSINFGDDSSQYARDGECDDPRFAGPGLAQSFAVENLGKDATDCSGLFQAGQVRLARTKAETSTAECASINFGGNQSQWANDRECDDPRFTGDGVSDILNVDSAGQDAGDCSALCQAGAVWLR